MPPALSVAIPTRNRAGYLSVALESLSNQDLDHAAELEIVVVDDASTDATPSVASHAGIGYVRFDRERGLNAARNAGVGATTAPLIAFIDDDVLVPKGWARALLDGAARHPEADAFGGPIRARFEGPTPRACGREKPAITTLDLGSDDVEAQMVWGSNMIIRRSAIERYGHFDEALSGHGDEEDWLLALRAAGGTIVYLAAAGVDHRRIAADSRLVPLTRAAYHRGRAARITDQRRGSPPRVLFELRVLAGCAWHTVHYACPQGVIMGAHSAGRLTEALSRRRRVSLY
jgi:glycosyltransferase involved in cell wall biosynthesis